VAGDQLLAASTAIDMTTALAHGEVVAGSTVFSYAIADTSGIRTVTFMSLTGHGGTASPGAIADYESLLDSLAYNNTSDSPPDGSQVVFSIAASDGITASLPETVTVTRLTTNEAPTFTSMNAFEGDEDTQSTITLADVQSNGNAADVDGSVTSFVVSAVTSGTLLIGTNAATASAWAAGTNDTIDATHQAYWTPDLHTTGDQGAFTVLARDDGGLLSGSPVAVQVLIGFPGLVITGTTGADNLVGTAGDDTIHGLAGNDVLTGGTGRDVLDGGAGTDSMDGGNGSDTYLFTSVKDHPAAEMHDSGTTGID
jgi:Ca2+-binding RTX toxin-like protein